MGGMQALEWALINGPEFVKSIIPIATSASHTAWQIGVSETQRQAIYADPKWNNGDVDLNDPPILGLSIARQIAMISYRTPKSFVEKFGRNVEDKSEKFKVQTYLEYQGRKFVARFDAMSFVSVTKQVMHILAPHHMTI